MKFTIQILVALVLAPFAHAQISSPAAGSGGASSRTDLYHVHFANAATGKAKELGDELKKPAPNTPMPDHVIVLRHEDGDSWDYCVITHPRNEGDDRSESSRAREQPDRPVCVSH
jgi:hypothetical protein